MEMFRRIFFAAVLAGTVAGLLSSAIQQWRVVPLIFEAEEYEVAPHAHGSAQDAQSSHAHAADVAAEPSEEPWAPADGIQRTAFTVLATVLTSLGFAFIIAAISTLMGMEITLSNGLLWGLGGFLTFSLMPAIGLSPELPGMVSADLDARQMWWWGAVLATGVALLLIAKFRSPFLIAIGLGLIALPHLIGAPIAPEVASDVPAHLASTFAANALFASLAFWLILGSGYGWINQNMLKGSNDDR